MTEPLRVIIEPEATGGAWNMAVDAVLLETALTAGRATLRWYRWREPTLSLGYFQAADDPMIDGRFAGLPRVRRLSGGGAILHDQEWTYSLAVGASHPLTTDPGRLYRVIHECVIDVLRRFDVPAALRGAGDATNHSFLCFGRGDPNDVVIGPHKVLGSAQRRRRGAVLQHGALLLRTSAFAAEFPGILDLAETAIDPASLFEPLKLLTAERISVRWIETGLDAREQQRARELVPHQWV